jgi:TonB family protein
MLTGLALLLAAQPCNSDPAVIKLADPNVSKAMYERISGTLVATVAVTLDAAGKVTDAKIYHSSGNSTLDDAAIDAAKRSTYSAGITNCAPSGGTFAVQFQFEGKHAVSADDDCPRAARVVTVSSPDAGPAIRASGLRRSIVVTVDLTIDRNGKLVEARIAQSSGNMALDQAALAAARQSTYEPQLEAVPVRRQAGDARSASDARVTCRAVTGKYLFKVTFEPH